MKSTISKCIFEFDDVSQTQIVFIRASDFASHKHQIRESYSNNPKKLNWFVGFKLNNIQQIEPVGWTNQNPNQTTAKEWFDLIWWKGGAK